MKIITRNGQVLKAISAYAKIEMIEGFAQVPEPRTDRPSKFVLDWNDVEWTGKENSAGARRTEKN